VNDKVGMLSQFDEAFLGSDPRYYFSPRIPLFQEASRFYLIAGMNQNRVLNLFIPIPINQ
jgi:hypothetical protein